MTSVNEMNAYQRGKKEEKERLSKKVKELRRQYSNDLSLDENNLIHKLETLDDVEQ